MKLLILLFLVGLIIPVYAQEYANPSLLLETISIPPQDFNTIREGAKIIRLKSEHPVSWQVTIQNDLIYANPNGNAILRLYDAKIENKFVEIGMGGPPERKFWVALNFPEEGYLPATRIDKNGWFDGAKVIAGYGDAQGITVNNGQRIVVSGIDLKNFVVGGYSVYGMNEPTDPPAINSGTFTIDVLSGDASKNPFHYYPFFVAGGVGALIGVLLLTKRRAS
ncbi:MAG: hypothetical protein JRZ94_04760 [Nitrososphaerota archaeon]|nr:hypothetical protein [Nitrososphaerota archaeon]